MEQMTNIQDQLNQILNGQPGELLSAAGTQAAYGALAAAVVVGLLVCFFGLKLVRILGTLMGFFAGAAIGAAAGLIIGLEGMAFAGIVLGAGIVFGLLSWFLYRVGVFLLVLAQVSGLVLTLLPGSWISAVVALAAGIIVAILSVICVEPFVILVTGIYGGQTAGTRCNDVEWNRDCNRCGDRSDRNNCSVYDAFQEGREERAKLLEKGERAGFYGV